MESKIEIGASAKKLVIFIGMRSESGFLQEKQKRREVYRNPSKLRNISLTKLEAMGAQAYFLILLCFVAFAMQGCDECSNAQPAPVAPIRFVIVDENGESLVLGSNARYSADSIRIINPNKVNSQLIYSKEYDAELDNIIFETYAYDSDKGSSILFLYFNKSDTDTLLVTYRTNKSRCFTIYSPNEFFLNKNKLNTSGTKNHLSIMK